MNRRHQRDGVPIVLDGVKLKYISPVRKQSRLELDLESKINKVCDSAAWVNRSWFTYDYHQMMIILGTVIFDFRDSRSFPFLYRTEGGCGGMPPYGNLDTAVSGIFAFHKGKAKHTILGIMDESVRCNRGLMSPNETFFIRSSHIAQMGDKAWLKYDEAFRALSKGLSPTQTKNLMSSMAGKDALPTELLEKGFELAPDNVHMGVAISHLRRDNFIMTELDVKMSLENEKKIVALNGVKPYSEVLQEIEDNKIEFKSNSWSMLAELSRFLPRECFSESIDMLQCVPDYRDEYDLSLKIMYEYYGLRSETHTEFTSFSYTDAIRVFKTSDVLEYMKAKSNILRTDIVYQLDPETQMTFSTDILAERKRKERIFNWLSAAELTTLLSEPLPPGIGPDDSRIMLSMLQKMEDYPDGGTTPLVMILFSGDRKLARGFTQYAKKKYPAKLWMLITIEPMQYIALCLESCREISELSSGYQYLPDPNADIVLYQAVFHGFREQLSNDIRAKLGARSYHYILEYDYPNIESFCQRCTMVLKTQ